ncbi:MAG TPA: hypothetical protein VGG01_04755 [Xanthobacteraceae bacterium]
MLTRSLPVIAHARAGTIASIFQPIAERPDLARCDPPLPAALLATPQRIDAFARYWLGFDNTHTVAIPQES